MPYYDGGLALDATENESKRTALTRNMFAYVSTDLHVETRSVQLCLVVGQPATTVSPYHDPVKIPRENRKPPRTPPQGEGW